MKRILSLLLAVAMLLSFGAVLVSCGETEIPGAQIDVYLGSEVLDLDPTDYYVDDNAAQLMSLLYEPLFAINSKGKLTKAAAKDYEIDEEKNQIIIELRESYWSDDIRVKAADFVFAWTERVLNPNNPNPAAALLYDIKNAAEVKSGTGTISDLGIKATDIYELTITYREGADLDQLLRNLASVATAPARKDVVDGAPTYWSKLANTMIFNGPFKVKSINVLSGEISLQRNLGYHQKPTELDYDNIVTPDVLVGFFTANGQQIECTYKDIEDKVVFYMADASLAERAEKKASAVTADKLSAYSYVFNTENPLFADARVRKALSVAIDRSAISLAVTFGKAADGILPDVAGGSTEAYISSSANKALAEELLSEVDFTGINKSFSITVNSDEQSLKIAELVEAAWEDLGFTVTVKTADNVVSVVNEMEIHDSGIQVAVKEASYGNRSFDVLAVDWQFYSDDAFVGLAAFSSALGGCGVDFATHTNRANISGWVDSQYDYLISAAYKASGAEREQLLIEAEEYLCEQSPIVPILFNQTFYYAHEDLSKIKIDFFGNVVFTEVKQKNFEDYLPEEE